MQDNGQAIPAADPGSTGTERFNFSRAGHLGADHHRTLRALDEQFARNLTYTLGAWLRTDVAVTPLPGEQTTFFGYAEQEAAAGYTIPIRMDPMHVRGALSLDLCLLSPMVDLLLGGSGKVSGTSRELTEIEEAILTSVLEIIVRELNVAWHSLGAEFILESKEREGQEQRLMLATEKVLAMHFEVLMPELKGRLSFCFSAAALNTLLRNLNSRHVGQRARTAEEQLEIAHRLAAAKTLVRLQFPPVRVSTSDLQRMQPGRLIQLNLAGSHGQLKVGDATAFSAEPVRSGDRRGARVLSVHHETAHL